MRPTQASQWWGYRLYLILIWDLEKWRKSTNDRTYLVVELRQLHLHFISLKVMVLGLLTHGWDQVELARHWVCLLSTEQRKSKNVTPLICTCGWEPSFFCEKSIHHDFHGTPAWSPPVHGHTLVYYECHGTYNLCNWQNGAEQDISIHLNSSNHK